MTAVTGVRAHQTMLDVTGNNIANVNTTGFKKDFTVFQDLLYQTTKGASGPGDQRGGVNPSQVGLGVAVGSIETVHSQGPSNYTGSSYDMMIEGEGFFVYRDGTSRLYSRAANLSLDAENNLVLDGTGHRLQGYQMIRDPLDPTSFIKDGDLTDIKIPFGSKIEARATTIVGFKCNLDSRSKTYLPNGYADIAYTDFPPESAKVKIGDQRYNITFQTDHSTANGEGYLTMGINVGSIGATNDAEVVFNMVGVANGLPELEIEDAQFELPDGTEVTATYDNETGTFKITKDDDGSTLWETNLHNNMNYSSFSGDVTAGTPAVTTSYNFLAEFDESNLDGSPTTLVLWYEDAGTMKRLEATVSFKADGTFDSVVPDPIAGAPGGMKITVNDKGTGLEVQMLKGTSTTEYETVGTIQQGALHATKEKIYDCQGNGYTLELQFKKVSENRWRWEAFFPDNPELAPSPSSGEITFGPCGKIVDPPFQDIEVPFSLVGTENSTITIDFSGESFGRDALEGITQYASATTTKPFYQDGYAMGVLEGFSVGQDGIVTGRYTNNQTLPIYRIALAQFNNPAGLEKVGGTMFRETINSGRARIDAAQEDGSGTINSGYLEGSNVDLTEEFTNLIKAQRGFQANARVVTTSDQILEEVVNLKR